MLYNMDEMKTGRQFELDVAKTFAVFFMIAVHALEYLSYSDGNVLPCVIEFFGCAPAAGIFMAAMGVGMVYTRHSSPGEFAVRGIKLLLMGYALNFFRDTLLVITGNVFEIENGYRGESIYSSLMAVDILQFAGIAFLSAALLKKLKLKPLGILAAAMILHAIGELCIGHFTKLPAVLQYPLGLLFSTNTEIAFPAFQWFIYPALGICFGSILKHISNKDKFYRNMAAASALSVISVMIGCKSEKISVYNMFMTDGYYQQTFLTALWCLSIVALCFPIYYAVSKILKGRAANAVKYVSANVNIIYILQWLIIDYLISIIELLQFDYLQSIWVIPVSMIITICSIIACMVFNKVKAQKKTN